MAITIAMMRQAGVTAEQIAVICELEQAERRAKDAARQRRHRESLVTNVTSRNVTDVTTRARARNEESSSLEDIKKEEEVNTPSSCLQRAGARARRACVIPDDFCPNEADQAAAREAGWSAEKLSTELIAFRDHAQAKGRTLRDWHAGFRMWIRSPYQAAGNVPRAPPGNGSARPMTARERILEKNLDVMDALDRYIKTGSNGAKAGGDSCAETGWLLPPPKA